MVKEFIRRYPLVTAGAGIFFNLGFVLPFALFNIWDKFSEDKVPIWIARRGWTMTGAIAIWLGGALVLSLLLVLVLYLVSKYCLTSTTTPLTASSAAFKTDAHKRRFHGKLRSVADL
jgi:hypothetical protein